METNFDRWSLRWNVLMCSISGRWIPPGGGICRCLPSSRRLHSSHLSGKVFHTRPLEISISSRDFPPRNWTEIEAALRDFRRTGGRGGGGVRGRGQEGMDFCIF